MSKNKNKKGSHLDSGFSCKMVQTTNPKEEALEKIYCGIDLHSNNNFIVVINESEEVKLKKRLPNDWKLISKLLAPFKDRMEAVTVESTFNWYWLVDKLREHGYNVRLANPGRMQIYKGLKHKDDDSDAHWLATMLRLKILPEGYIYPKEERGLRDLLRKRMRLVQAETGQVLSLQSLFARQLGIQVSKKDLLGKHSDSNLESLFGDVFVAMNAQSSLTLIRSIGKEIAQLEKAIFPHLRIRPDHKRLMEIDGIGKVLASVIVLETGDIERFKEVGNYASYCRCVKSEYVSNNKTKGKGNVKNGNKYLGWAMMEAAEFCRRYDPKAQKYFQRKSASTKPVIARKALAHKIARACYYILKRGEKFERKRIFGE